MTKSNNEWVPDVGDNFEFKQPQQDNLMWKQSTARYVGDNLIIGYHEGLEWAISIGCNAFRQVKTEAEKRRELVVAEMVRIGANAVGDTVFSVDEYDQVYVQAISRLYDAGFIKPKPLTNDVIDSVMRHAKFSLTTYRDFAKAIEAYIRGEG